MAKFKCWGCGACCRFIGFKIPAFDKGDKSCIHLRDDMTCGIYDKRPQVCRLDPDRPAEEQEQWCRLTEENWPTYVKMLENLVGG